MPLRRLFYYAKKIKYHFFLGSCTSASQFKLFYLHLYTKGRRKGRNARIQAMEEGEEHSDAIMKDFESKYPQILCFVLSSERYIV